jgi:FkbM family methyltransferase
VLAFEPERENFALLTANIATNGYTNVQPLNMAVTAQSGMQRLFVSSENAGDHHLYAAGDDRPSYEVEAVSLDDFFAGRPKVVNVIKMDVQGSEPFALQGMREVLEANDSVLLFTELAPKSLSDAGSSAPEYAQALRDAGFDLHVIDEETGTLEPTTVDQLTRTDFRRENHINLLCSKGDAFQERVRASAEPGLIRA